ncbi:MAG: hypothetical protein H6739_30655 [Alphaproteobacteria bacterium]|nr:hypothetical protein [Alphaproteobacteria bacterium]
MSGPRVGDRIGPFALRKRLDTRDSGVQTWRAERVDGKLLSQAVAMRVGQGDALRAEYEALRALDDPRVPRLVGYYAGQGALAMQWIEGATLRELVDAAPDRPGLLDRATALDLAVEVAQALRAAHAASGAPIVHGGLRPRHVRVDPEGEVWVLGWGRTGGTDPREDQPLLGALLVELVTQKPLKDAGDDLKRMVTEDPALMRILRKLGHADPEQRYLSDAGALKALHTLAREDGGASSRADLIGRWKAPERALPPSMPSLQPMPPMSQVVAGPTLEPPTTEQVALASMVEPATDTPSPVQLVEVAPATTYSLEMPTPPELPVMAPPESDEHEVTEEEPAAVTPDDPAPEDLTEPIAAEALSAHDTTERMAAEALEGIHTLDPTLEVDDDGPEPEPPRAWTQAEQAALAAVALFALVAAWVLYRGFA